MADTLNLCLNEHFGFSGLRDGQLRIIDYILNTLEMDGVRDLVCTFPTGYGKSISYLLPVLKLQGVALVVSPLCSLIADQVEKINRRHDNRRVAFNLSGTDNGDEADAFSTGSEHDGCARVLYCTPEKLASDFFRRRLVSFFKKRALLYIIVDEAHLLSVQGNTFRPDYLKLSIMRETFPATPIYCFSATMNSFTISMLREILKLKYVEIFQLEPDRQNLHLNVHYVNKHTRGCSCTVVGCTWADASKIDNETIMKSVDMWKAGEVLVFCSTRQEVEQMAAFMQSRLPLKRISHYHGGMNIDERNELQSEFLQGRIDVLVATGASFAVGVDMPNVIRLVIFGIQNNIEDFIQAIGRGGRKMQPYYVDVFVKNADVEKHQIILRNEVKSMTKAFSTYSIDSFSLVRRFLDVSASRERCLVNFLDSCTKARRTKLSVPFSSLSEIKRINKLQLKSIDRAQWDGNAKTWYLYPLAHVSPFRQWISEAQAPRDSGTPCHRCTTCKPKAVMKRKLNADSH